MKLKICFLIKSSLECLIFVERFVFIRNNHRVVIWLKLIESFLSLNDLSLIEAIEEFIENILFKLDCKTMEFFLNFDTLELFHSLVFKN